MSTKSDRHWYPRYPGDYARKTAHLSLVEHGAYALLMDWYYSNGKPLPNDWVQMHRICKAIAPDEQAAVNVIVQQFFILSDAGWSNARADEEIIKKAEISDKRREAQRIREQIRRKKDANEPTKGGANAPSNALTSTTTSTTTDIDTNVSISDIPGSLAVTWDGPFQSLWHAYLGIGKNGVLSEAFKGSRKPAQQSYFQILTKTKESDREALVRDIADGARSYAHFLKQSGYNCQHLSTWLEDRGWERDYTLSCQPDDPLQGRFSNGQKPSYSDSIASAAGAAIDHIRARDA